MALFLQFKERLTRNRGTTWFESNKGSAGPFREGRSLYRNFVVEELRYRMFDGI
jgi:hypothetical protein